MRLLVAIALFAMVLPRPVSAGGAVIEVVRLHTPARATLTKRHVARTLVLTTIVRNLGATAVTFADATALGAALGLAIMPATGPIVCPVLVPEARGAFPVTFPPGRRRALRWRLPLVCGPNPDAAPDWTIAAGGRSATIDVVDRRASTAFALPGRYAVGKTRLMLVDASRPTMANGDYPGAPDRTLPTIVWYPATTAGTDVAVARQGAPFPLVVFSHGLGAPPDQSTFYASHLASHGYVVVAPAFPLSTLLAPGGPTLADVPNQARDISFLLDTFVGLAATPRDRFAGAIDADRIALSGHSNGGIGTLVAAYDRTVRDPRIKAAIPMSPVSCFLQPGYFDDVTVPLLILHGDADRFVDFVSYAEPTYERANAPKSLVRVHGGNHIGFADIGLDIDDLQACTLLLPAPADLVAGAVGFITNMGGASNFVSIAGCPPPACAGDPTHIAAARQQQIAKQTALAFLEMLFRGDRAGERYLYDELAKTTPDVTHEFVR
jgi:fermentation-respiration switch protein FrsA (DUF1100 family)